jgi:glucose dehydrogenase
MTMQPIRASKRTALRGALRSVLLFTFAALALLGESADAVAGENLLQALKPVTDAMLTKPAPEDWLTRRGDYRAWRYSELDQIRSENVGRLKLAWAWNMEPGYQEEAPLAHDGVIFLANPRMSFKPWMEGISARAAEDRRRLSQRSA